MFKVCLSFQNGLIISPEYMLPSLNNNSEHVLVIKNRENLNQWDKDLLRIPNVQSHISDIAVTLKLSATETVRNGHR